MTSLQSCQNRFNVTDITTNTQLLDVGSFEGLNSFQGKGSIIGVESFCEHLDESE
jgi:hypothetical protein